MKKKNAEMAVDFYLTNEDDGRLTSETQTIEAL